MAVSRVTVQLEKHHVAGRLSKDEISMANISQLRPIRS